jgi:hypothetical protein
MQRDAFNAMNLALRTSSKETLKNAFTSLRFEVFMAVNGVFWDVTPCGSCKNRRFGGT